MDDQAVIDYLTRRADAGQAKAKALLEAPDPIAAVKTAVERGQVIALGALAAGGAR